MTTRHLRLLLGAAVMGLAIYFLMTAAHFFAGTPEALGKYASHKWFILTHISAGAFALLTGPLLLSNRLRAFRPAVHRMLGKAYLAFVLASGFAAVVLSFTTAYVEGWPYAFSLQVWVGAWLIASAIAYRAALRRNFKLHKEWMTRSYLVLFAFVVGALIFKLPSIRSLGTLGEAAPSIFWFSWAVPLYLYDSWRAARVVG
jgi:hypothetical protein